MRIVQAILLSLVVTSSAFAQNGQGGNGQGGNGQGGNRQGGNGQGGNGQGGNGGNFGAPGPIAGAGLPLLAVGYGIYWLVKRRRRTDA
jgi:hypothetical protein